MTIGNYGLEPYVKSEFNKVFPVKLLTYVFSTVLRHFSLLVVEY